VLSAEISDSTDDLTALFHGRDRIPGLMWRRGPAARSGGGSDSSLVMENPACELLIPDGAGRDEY
jgi:hypothetical protein